MRPSHRALLLAPLLMAGGGGDHAAARVVPNDNRVAAGRREGGVLTLALEARLAQWHPEGDAGPGVAMQAFAEAGRPAQIPGPMVRVPTGTIVQVTVRNTLADTLVVHGLHDRAATPAVTATAPAPMRVAPGASRAVRFTLGAPGTYFYWGTTSGRPLDLRTREDAQLNGAIVVDPRGAPPSADRVLVISEWTDTIARAMTTRRRFLGVVNGRAWPHTERLRHAVGDTVRWRVVNASADLHPMHLHGFHFRVDARGDGTVDSAVAGGRGMLAVTEVLRVGWTTRLTWVPERAGNWLFHCHIPEHFGARGPLGTMRPAAHAHATTAAQHATAGMGGLVMGIEVRPRGARAAADAAPVPDARRRHLRLLVRQLAGGTARVPVFGYALQEGTAAPTTMAPDRVGPTMVLERGQPVRITVVNQLDEPTAVHWHGIELESYFDGVPGFSGAGRRVTPLIAPGDSFEVRFTPPRAGTFMYHTHADEERQQLAGLVGPLLVMEPGVRHDAATDIPIVFTSPRDSADELRHVLVDGALSPPPLELRVGTTYRLRFINMTMRRAGPRVELRTADTTVLARWRLVAKDGADLPAEAARTLRPAHQVVGIGEVADVLYTPEAPGELALNLRAMFPVAGVPTPGPTFATRRVVVRP